MAEQPLPGGGRFDYTDHLVDLVAQAQRSAAYLATASDAAVAPVAAAARRRSALLSARLDGSPLTDETARVVDDGRHAAADVETPRPVGRRDDAGSGWARVLRLEGIPTQHVAALEYANLLAAWDAEPAFADGVLDAPLQVLVELHAIVCNGLVAPDLVGKPRRTDQAVHDGAQGRMLYRAADPAAVPRLLEGLAEWLGHGSAGKPDLVVAGVVHERLLEWQPFEAGNGRLARAVSRVLLRARGLDIHGVAVPETVWARDPFSYYGEVAATIRRRGDLRPWLESWGEALVEALDVAVAAAGTRPDRPVPVTAVDVASQLVVGESVTVPDVAARVGVGRDTALQALRSLAVRGVVRVERGTRGLRYRRCGSDP